MYFLFLLALGIRIVVLQPFEDCPECDPNDYHPVCSRGRAYYSLCKLKREMCLQEFDESYIYYGACKVSHPHSKGHFGKWYPLLSMLAESVDRE